MELVTQVVQMQLLQGSFAKNGLRHLGIPMLENTTIVETPNLISRLKCGVTQLILRLNGSSVLCLFVLLEKKMLVN